MLGGFYEETLQRGLDSSEKNKMRILTLRSAQHTLPYRICAHRTEYAFIVQNKRHYSVLYGWFDLGGGGGG